MKFWMLQNPPKKCPQCRGPVYEIVDEDGNTYFMPLAEYGPRNDFQQEMLRDRLFRAERIIVELRARVKELEGKGG